jgi:hypothetical protein
VLVPAACRQVGLTVFEFSRLVATAPVVGAVPAALLVAILRRSLPPASLPAILLEGSAVGVVYLVSVCMFGLNADVRIRYFDYLRRLVATSPLGRMKAAPV